MNLHGVAGPMVAAVNPTVQVRVKRSTGYTTGQTGKRTPTYTVDATTVDSQTQPVSATELRHVNSLGIQGNLEAFYLYGFVANVVRADGTGGDLIVDAARKTWLVVMNAEQWPDWCRVVGCLQVQP